MNNILYVCPAGHQYTREQVDTAINCCKELALVYAKSDPANGGSESIEWSSIDFCKDMAEDALPLSVIGEITIEALRTNW